MKNRAVSIYGELTYDHLDAVVRAPYGSPVLLCSPGGGSDLCIAITNLVRRKRMPTVALGEVASAAALIFAAGSVRVAMGDAVLILHRPSIDLTDQLDPQELLMQSRGFTEFEAWYFARIEQYGLCPSVIANVRSGGDWSVPAWAGLDCGLVDAILQPVDAARDELHPLSEEVQAIVRALNIPVDRIHLSYKAKPLEEDNGGDGGSSS